MSQNPEFLSQFEATLRWVQAIQQSEFISTQNWHKTYLGFSRISQRDLTLICTFVNDALNHAGMDLRVANNMGEIIPLRRT